MVRRLIINSGGLRITKPGVDIGSASSLRDYLFNSEAGSYMGIFATGQVNMGAFSPSGQENAGFSATSTVALEIGYGKTFASPPLVLAMFVNSHFAGACPQFNEGNSYTTTSGGLITGHGGGTIASYKSYVDRLRFEINYFVNSGSSPLPGPNAIAYLIAEK